MAGPLFRELAEGLTPHYVNGVLLLTGHPDTLAMQGKLIDGLVIKKSPSYDRRSMIKRMFSWVKYLVVASFTILTAKKTDGFLITSNPPILGGWFWLLNYLRNRPYAILVYDIHPDVLVMMGVVTENNPVVKVWNWMNRKIYQDAAAVITLGNHMASRLSRQYATKNKLPYVIPPWVDIEKIKPIPFDENPLVKSFNPDGKRVILYSGNMGISHDIDSMLEAAKILQYREDLLFLFIGAGDKWQDAVDFSNDHNLENIKVYPFQPEELLPMTMALATISLVALDVGAEELMVPSKIFHYLSVGSAVVGICQGENELTDIIEKNSCGYCVRPGNPRQLSRIIEVLLGNTEQLKLFQSNARKIAVESYSKNSGIYAFSKVLEYEELM